jgi:hypothetical protein
MESLVRFNKKMGFAHLIQAIIMVLIALFIIQDLTDFQPEIIVYYQGLNENFELVTLSRVLFELPFSIVTTSFLFLSAFFHFLIVLNKKTYTKQIEKGYNVFRWYEYALSSSILIVLLAVLFGVKDLQTLSIIFISNAVMNLLGLEMERSNQGREKKSFFPYILGWIIGLAPWVVIFMYLGFTPGLDLVPWYAWASIGGYFLFFNSFAFNMLFQYLEIGPYKNYVFGEKVYIWLSLIAKSTIAWIVYTGAIQTSDIISQLF